MNYREFLENKIDVAPLSGIEVEASEVSPVLKPHQRDAVLWALKGGRRGIFARFGLGKTVMQLDIVERLINRYSNEGDLVADPFAGLFTVPYMAVKMGRRGKGVELNADYFRDGVGYCEAADSEANAPTLFDLIGG